MDLIAVLYVGRFAVLSWTHNALVEQDGSVDAGVSLLEGKKRGHALMLTGEFSAVLLSSIWPRQHGNSPPSPGQL